MSVGNPDVIERQAEMSDLRLLLEVERSAFPEERWASEASLARRLELPQAETWVVLLGELLAGFSNGFPIDDLTTQAELDPPDSELYFAGGKVWMLRNVAVRPSCQGKGIGRRLIERQLFSARKHGAHTFRFTATENLTAYYSKLGFRMIREPEVFHGLPQAVWEAPVSLTMLA